VQQESRALKARHSFPKVMARLQRFWFLFRTDPVRCTGLLDAALSALSAEATLIINQCTRLATDLHPRLQI
jgi:hypothetical protein